jgi:ferredoxin
MSVKWIFEIDREKCDGCEICVDECPVEAISLNDDNIAEIDDEECVECGTCVDLCPKNAISGREEKIIEEIIEDPKKSKIFSRIRKYLY